MNLKFFTHAILLALTLAFQMLKLPQPMTGPAVNAMLFISTAAVGIWGGVIIGTPTMDCLYKWNSEPCLAPAIPFIMLAMQCSVLYSVW